MTPLGAGVEPQPDAKAAEVERAEAEWMVGDYLRKGEGRTIIERGVSRAYPSVDVGDVYEAGKAAHAKRTRSRVKRERDREDPEKVVAAVADRGRRIEITWASEIEMANIEWIWENRIPLGMLSGLYGVEGMGKSMETIRIAAAVTRGGLPGDLEGKPRCVLIATTEDTWKHTVAPRLKAAGADMSMVGHFRIQDGGDDTGFELPRDADVLAEAAVANDVGLVILDPVLSHLEGRADSHNTKDVRKALEPLQRAAETAGFGVLGIMHFNKEKGSDPRQRGQASSAFREVFRSTLVFGPDPDRPGDKSARVVALDKNNLVPPQPSYRMRIEGVTLDETDPKTGEPITSARIVLGEPCAYTAEELLRAGVDDGKGNTPEASAAREFLRKQLIEPKSVGDVKKAAEAEGISTSALEKARQHVGVKPRRAEFGGDYEWYLPEQQGEKVGI